MCAFMKVTPLKCHRPYPLVSMGAHLNSHPIGFHYGCHPKFCFTEWVTTYFIVNMMGAYFNHSYYKIISW